MSEHVKGSSDDFIDANIQLALAVVRKLQQKVETRACIVRIFFHLLISSFLSNDMLNFLLLFQVFPDKPEKRRASQLFKAALDSVINELVYVTLYFSLLLC